MSILSDDGVFLSFFPTEGASSQDPDRKERGQEAWLVGQSPSEVRFFRKRMEEERVWKRRGEVQSIAELEAEREDPLLLFFQSKAVRTRRMEGNRPLLKGGLIPLRGG